MGPAAYISQELDRRADGVRVGDDGFDHLEERGGAAFALEGELGEWGIRKGTFYVPELVNERVSGVRNKNKQTSETSEARKKEQGSERSED